MVDGARLGNGRAAGEPTENLPAALYKLAVVVSKLQFELGARRLRRNRGGEMG
jgi:hypothetical protein